MFEAKKIFEKSPTIRVSYLAGALQALTLKLPVTIHKFMDPADLSAEDFFKRWKQIGGGGREAQEIFGLSGSRNGAREMTERFVAATVEGFRWRLLDMVDPNPKNVVGASVLHTSEGGKFGCLLRLEPNYTTQVSYFDIFPPLPCRFSSLRYDALQKLVFATSEPSGHETNFIHLCPDHRSSFLPLVYTL